MSHQREGDSVEIRISVADGDLADLESLDDWLRGEPELAGRVKAVGSPPTQGQLGALTEVLTVALGSGGAITVLAASLKGWVSLPRRSDVRIKIHRSDGGTVEIDAKRVNAGDVDVESMIRQALDYGTGAEVAALDPAVADHQALEPGTTGE
jgi:Effector Associated Constant Component 1